MTLLIINLVTLYITMKQELRFISLCKSGNRALSEVLLVVCVMTIDFIGT